MNVNAKLRRLIVALDDPNVEYRLVNADTSLPVSEHRPLTIVPDDRKTDRSLDIHVGDPVLGLDPRNPHPLPAGGGSSRTQR